MRTRLVLATLLLVPQLAAADGLRVLTVDKVAAFRNDGGTVRVGRDPELDSPPSPACPSASAVVVSSYPVATQRVVTTTSVDLDCASGRRRPAASSTTTPPLHGGAALGAVRTSRDSCSASAGPSRRRRDRRLCAGVAHRRRDAVQRPPPQLRAQRRRSPSSRRKPSRPASDRRARVLGGPAPRLARLLPTRRSSSDRARRRWHAPTKRDKRDGWSRFLLAMMHLYQLRVRRRSASPRQRLPRGEVAAAHAAFAGRAPLVWDGTAGDSRVPGFAAAATFAARRTCTGDAALQDQGLAELDAAFQAESVLRRLRLHPGGPGAPVVRSALPAASSPR